MNKARALACSWTGRVTLGLALAGAAALLATTGDARARAASKSPSAVATAASFTGLWLDHTGRGAVEISLCNKPKTRPTGQAPTPTKKSRKSRKKAKSKTALCGRIVWLKNPFNKKGEPLTDKLNTRRSRRRRKICGLKVLGNVKRISKRVYDRGWIYAPEKGKSFDVELRLRSNNILQVKGYLGIKVLNETYLWKRIHGDLERCPRDRAKSKTGKL